MKKVNYLAPELEVIEFRATEDVITASIGSDGIGDDYLNDLYGYEEVI